MPASRLVLILAAVLLAGAATVLLMIALPPGVRPWLIPILMIAALAIRAASRPSERHK